MQLKQNFEAEVPRHYFVVCRRSPYTARDQGSFFDYHHSYRPLCCRNCSVQQRRPLCVTIPDQARNGDLRLLTRECVAVHGVNF
jgi:hypothetical protein